MATPGNYHIERRTTPGQFVTDTLIVSDKGSVLATVGPCDIEENAQLFSAAPELAKALARSAGMLERAAMGYRFEPDQFHSESMVALAALRKAGV